MKILVLGDSHTEAFMHIQKSNMLASDKLTFDVFAIPGATAQGIKNVNSKTQALSSFKKRVQETKGQYDCVILMLGEVDCGFAIWYRAEQHGLKIEDQLKFAIDQYKDFVKNELVPIFGKKIILCGAHLPTLRDNKDNKDLIVQRARMTVKLQASQKQRTDLTLRYNKLLKELSLSEGYKYGSITKYCIDNKTGLLKEEIPSTGNHHLPLKLSSKYWTEELKKILGE